MTPERWKQAQALFLELADLPPEERARRLHELAAADPALHREVEALLDADRRTLPWLDAPAFPAWEPPPLPERIGPYRLLDEIGRGGMGVVYRAERADGSYTQVVALKVAATGLGDAELVRRFHQERQILARLEHPGIARLLDGGTLPDGHPYLVMEYVDGVPLDRYCDARRLTVTARLRLFEQVLRAVQYAHRHLVVHRDLKPANILVTEAEGQPRVKLLDFGIARLLEDEAGAALTRTVLHRMTPVYASPEQLRGEPVTTASDIYTLGVILYELLTGRRPFEGPPGLLVSHVLTQDPPLPSRIVTRPVDPPSDAAPEALIDRLGATPAQLARRLRGDLDAIVLKALEKDPADRYASADAFLNDLERHRAHLPVLARRATAGYRLRRFLLRHRTGAAMTAAFVALLLVAAGLFTWRLAQERDRARLEAQKARAALAFVEDLFDGADPDATAGDTLDVFDLLARGARRLEQPGALPPAEAAQTAHTLGALYLKLGDYDAAERWLTAALDGWRRLPRAEAEAEAATLVSLGHLATHRGDYARADSFFAAALARPAGAPADRAGRLVNYGDALAERQDYRRADSVLHRALALLPGTDPASEERRADAWFVLGTIAMNEADYARAESLFARVLAWREAHLGRMHNRTLDVLNNLGNLYADEYRYEEADSLLSEVLRLRTALLGPEHPLTGEALNNLGLVAFGLGDYDRADALLRRSLALAERHAGPMHRDVGMTMNNLGWVALCRNRPQDAEALFRRALAIMEAASGPVSADAALLLGNVGFVLHQQGRPADALPFFRRAVDVRRQVHGDSSMHVAWRLFALGEALRDLGRLDEAEAVHRESVALRRALRPPDHFDLARGLDGLARVLTDQGRHDDAIDAFEEALPIYRTSYEGNLLHPTLWTLLRNLIASLNARGQYERAGQLLAELRAALPPGDPRHEDLARLQVAR